MSQFKTSIKTNYTTKSNPSSNSQEFVAHYRMKNRRSVVSGLTRSSSKRFASRFIEK
jgi:hypothetical protein